MHTSSLNDLAQNLIKILDRNNIFPPAINKPEDLIGITKPDTRTRRPPNGFLLCRKNVHREARLKGTCNMRVISKVTGMLWREASAEEKETYEQLALDVQTLHSQKYPGYRYRPSRSKAVPLYHPYLNTSSVPILTQMTIPQVNYNAPLLFQPQQEFDLLQYFNQPPCNNVIDYNAIYPLYSTASTWDGNIS
ncbi:8735_t:CDS:2 [Cetraspora pellucida]|uniref:8735_t:CDS:1 n=1 Tax=Cetraspora pellucida TaxID=1433469 RepID=A0ACA9LMG0_9GLOM|nr:8735_t:CDS:2 [Cetraspora pellucida]